MIYLRPSNAKRNKATHFTILRGYAPLVTIQSVQPMTLTELRKLMEQAFDERRDAD